MLRNRFIMVIKKAGEMDFRLHSHRHAEAIMNNVPELYPLWNQVKNVIEGITDESLIHHFQTNYEGKRGSNGKLKQTKSISKTLNQLISDGLGAIPQKDAEKIPDSWIKESRIFGDSEYGVNEWRLDFAKKVQIQDLDVHDKSRSIDGGISIEVAFNNGGSAAWNLVKPVIASELNHIDKDIQTSVGIVITATDEFKKTGNFDSTVASYSDYLAKLIPMRDLISVPLLIIGLEAPRTFVIEEYVSEGKKHGRVKRLAT